VDYSVSEFHSCIALRFSGNLTGGPDTARFSADLHKLIDNGRKQLVVDLADVQFVDSGGLGMLISGLTTMRNAGGDLRIAGAGPRIIRLLTVTNLFTVFNSYPTLEEAVKSFQQQE